MADQLDLWGSTTAGKGLVYAIECSDAIKIGYTKSIRHLHRRIAKLQAANPNRLRLLAAFPGNRDLESHLHKQLAIVEIRPEWFQKAPALVLLWRLQFRKENGWEVKTVPVLHAVQSSWG